MKTDLLHRVMSSKQQKKLQLYRKCKKFSFSSYLRAAIHNSNVITQEKRSFILFEIRPEFSSLPVTKPPSKILQKIINFNRS